ncbi:hypothetical protein PG984_014915 [Apiospora sp. TS-2023a]
MSSPSDWTWACAFKGWAIGIPMKFLATGTSIKITARYMCQTKWDDFISGGAQAYSSRVWRSAARKLTEAEKADPSEEDGTFSYMLVGFAYPGSKVDVAKEKPEPGLPGEWLGYNENSEVGLVVVALSDAYIVPLQTYLLLDMMDGLCTPYKFDQEHVFYLPEFRVNAAAGNTRWQHWNQEIRSRARALLENDTAHSSDEEMILDEGAKESSASDACPESISNEELPDDSMSLFVPEKTDPDPMEVKLYEEEPPAEAAVESSKRGEPQTLNHTDAGDPDTNPEHMLRFIDELSQMTAVCETSQDIQHIDHTLRIHLAQNPYQENSAMRKFLDLSRQWDYRDSHAFCVEMAASGHLNKAPRLSEVTSIREGLVYLEAKLGYESLGTFFRFTMVLLEDEPKKPVPQQAVSYAVLKSLQLLVALPQAN